MAVGDIQHPVKVVFSGESEDKLQEDVQNGLPSVSGSRHPVEGSIQRADDRIMIILTRETVSESTVFGVRGGDAVGVAGSTTTESAQEGNGREMALGDHVHRQRDTHLKDGFSNRGGGG